MKKTSKAFMGVTALVIAFSACALTACNSEPKDGSIKGNYQEATTEEVATTLSAVEEEKLFGDTTVEGYKFGLDISSDINFNSDVENVSSTTLSLNAGYKMLLTGSQENAAFKGAGNLSFNYKNVLDNPAEGVDGNIDRKASLEAYQDDAILYATLNTGKKEGETEDNVEKLKIDFKALAGELTPEIGDMPDTGDTPAEDLPVPDLPTDVPTEMPSYDLSAAVAMLTAQGATFAMDKADGIKLKVSITEEMIQAMLAKDYGDKALIMLQAITFNKCILDVYLSIDKAGVFSAASIVMDIDYKFDASNIPQLAPLADDETTTLNTSTFKLNGFIKIKANPDINPEIPADIATDTSYIDGTETISGLIGGLIGGIIGGDTPAM